MSDVTLDTPELSDRYDRVSDAQFMLGRSLVNVMGIRKGDRVLDVGCGTGRLAMSVVDIVGPSGSVLGLDPSPYRIRIANERLDGSLVPNLKFGIGVGEDLSSISDGGFDHVYYSSVFHWITDKEAALREAFRVLRPGGTVGMTTPARDGPFTLGTIIQEVLSRPPYAGHTIGASGGSIRVTKQEIGTLLTQAGFEDLNVEIRESRKFHRSPSELLEFYEASSFGNYMRHVPEGIREDLKRDIWQELEKRRTPNGIELASNTMFAMARKPFR